MQRLDLIMEQYLDIDTDYALLITGAWGTGKTYHFNNKIRPIIEEKSTAKDKSKKYKVISISLFGLKSVGEIQTQILLSSFQLTNNKIFKNATAFFGTLTKGVLNATGISADSVDTSLWAEALNQIKGFNDLVICFDDVERKSSELETSQLIGFINLLIEKHGTKIIIIANESKITNFIESKEKVIGNTIEYIPDYGDIFDNILTNIFKTDMKYNEFLSLQKDFILDIFKKTSKNLRTLKYALYQFKKVYIDFNELCKNETNLLKNREVDVLKDALKFTIVISEEYRTGQVSFSNKNEIDSLDTLSMIMAKDLFNKLDGEKDETEEKTYLKIFHDKYYSFSDNYKYFHSIYSFITGGDVFKIESFRSEMIDIYRIDEQGIILPQYEILNNLFWENVYGLENNEYKSLTISMLKYAYNGSYKILSEYYTVFCYALRFNNILGYSPELLVDKIKKGIKKANIKSVDLSIKYHPNEFKNINEQDIHKTHKDKLSQFILKENNLLENHSQKKELKKDEKKCKEDISSFCIKLHDENSMNVLKNFNPRVFYFAYINSTNHSKYLTYYYLNEAFVKQKYYLDEIEYFLQELNILFEKGSKRHFKKSLSGYYYNAMSLLIKEQIIILDERKNKNK